MEEIMERASLHSDCTKAARSSADTSPDHSCKTPRVRESFNYKKIVLRSVLFTPYDSAQTNFQNSRISVTPCSLLSSLRFCAKDSSQRALKEKTTSISWYTDMRKDKTTSGI